MQRTAGGRPGSAYAGVGATGGIRMMTSRESRLAQPPARTRIVAWNTCGRVVSRTISFFASTMKRTRLPGVTFLKPWSVMIGGGMNGGGGGGSASSGMMLEMKSAVVLPAGSVSPFSPIVRPWTSVITSKLAKRASCDAGRHLIADASAIRRDLEHKRAQTVFIRLLASPALTGAALAGIAARRPHADVPGLRRHDGAGGLGKHRQILGRNAAFFVAGDRRDADRLGADLVQRLFGLLPAVGQR